MRYNLYRKYKTLSGYNSGIISSVAYLEKNYKFSMRSYDFITSIPSNIFESLTQEDANYEAGCKFKFYLDHNNLITKVEVYRMSRFLSEYELVDVLPFEPNSMMISAYDPDGSSGRDLIITAYNSNGEQVNISGSNSSGIYNGKAETYEATWAYLPGNGTPTSNVYLILTCRTSSTSIQTTTTSGVDHLTVEYIIDSDDTQARSYPLILYTPTFVPIE